MNKLKKALKVAKDLEHLDFQVWPVDQRKPLKLNHPDERYSIWVANGFWFIALYEVNGESIGTDHNLSKFGAIGKVIVWWKTRKYISDWYKEKKSSSEKILEHVFK